MIRDIILLCQEYIIQEGQVKVGCDEEEAFKIATCADFSPTTTISHYDMVSTLHYLINNSPITWSFCHVKGHQDDNIDSSKN